MEWQAIVFALQILLLATGWVLFQRARAELSVRAAETPILNEVKALQRSVKQMLADMEQASDNASARLETRCGEAQSLLTVLEQRLAEWDARVSMPAPTPASAEPSAPPARARRKKTEIPAIPPQENSAPTQAIAVVSEREARRQNVYKMADGGSSAVGIARETGLSEGEVETLLALRPQRSIR